jgi:tartrate dehydrogenase/decarboxylase/D-malate dehydrogenase
LTHRVAVIPGDGVGPEVVLEARKSVDALELGIEWIELPWGSAYWHRHGTMMPRDGLETLGKVDAIFLGAVGDPAIPDHVTLWGLVLAIRQGLDLWANVRPTQLLAGVPSPLAGKAGADVDMLFLRENTEGEYAGVGGRAHVGYAHEVAVEVSIFTRTAIERLIRYGFELARGRRGLLTSATKSNASRYGYVLWDEIAREIADEFPEVEYQRVLVDALAARLVRNPESLDVVIASNLFGDILTDIAAEFQGGMGMAASASLAPGGETPGVFEPIHGSAPDIAGMKQANPIGAILSAALMLEHLGEGEGAERLHEAVAAVCRDGPKTPDIGGTAATSEVGDAVVEHVTTVVAR